MDNRKKISIIEIGHLDIEPPDIGEVVWIPVKYGREGKKYPMLLEVIYTDEHGLPLMFHSLDFQYGYPDIKEYVRFTKTPHPDTIN